jgi:dynein intermediate chain 1
MKIMERTIRQNEEDKKYNDYKYYWQEGEESQEQEGELLPIWRLSYEKKKKHVTSIVWNPKYKDLFAISLGSYDFAKQKAGQILVWSLKNVTHPEYKYESLQRESCVWIGTHHRQPCLQLVSMTVPSSSTTSETSITSQFTNRL